MRAASVAAVTPFTEGLVASAIVVAVTAIGWLVVTWIGHRYVERVAGDGEREGTIAAAERTKRVRTVWTMVRRILSAVLVITVVLILLSIWGIPTAPLIALGSAFGLAVGFGAQNFVRDVIAGLLIIGEGQYAIGDRVQIAGVSGLVETIRLRTTVLRETDGNLHHVPNGLVQVATNLTRDYGQVVIDMTVPNEVDLDRVTAILAEESAGFAADPEWEPRLLSVPEVLGLEELGSSSVKIRLAFRVEPNSRWAARREFLRRVKVRFDVEGMPPPASGP